MRRLVPWFLLGLGLALLGAGLWREEWRAVFSRAARICLTCIGIG